MCRVDEMTEHDAKAAEKIRVIERMLKTASSVVVQEKFSADVILPLIHGSILETEKLIVIGASTGGTEAVREVLIKFPADAPAILVTQHMPENFTQSFAERLNTLCKITVKEAKNHERILPGHAYIAPGHSHLLLKRHGANYVVELNQGLPVNRHCPSVDVLFRSAANVAGNNAIGVLLTGMGKDGAQGLLEMRHRGSHTIAQDEESCVVFGMPKEAIALGGACEVLPLSHIARRTMEYLRSHDHHGGNRHP